MSKARMCAKNVSDNWGELAKTGHGQRQSGGYTIVNIDIALQENMRRQTTFLNVSLAVIFNFLIYIIAPFNDASLVLFM